MVGQNSTSSKLCYLAEGSSVFKVSSILCESSDPFKFCDRSFTLDKALNEGITRSGQALCAAFHIPFLW